jgi:hypothetical protein
MGGRWLGGGWVGGWVGGAARVVMGAGAVGGAAGGAGRAPAPHAARQSASTATVPIVPAPRLTQPA